MKMKDFLITLNFSSMATVWLLPHEISFMVTPGTGDIFLDLRNIFVLNDVFWKTDFSV